MGELALLTKHSFLAELQLGGEKSSFLAYKYLMFSGKTRHGAVRQITKHSYVLLSHVYTHHIFSHTLH